MTLLRLILMCSLVTLPRLVIAAPKSAPPTPKPLENRSKSLSFDDSLVEGMNRNPLDSIESVGKEDTARQPHLYNKRLNFKKELKDSVKDSGYQP